MPYVCSWIKHPRAELSSASFSACALVIIPHSQGSLNMCLITATLVAVFMHWGWKRDFLSCNVLKTQTNKQNPTTCRKIQSKLLQDWQGLGETFALDLETISSLQGCWWELHLFCCLKSLYMELKFSKRVSENGHSQNMICWFRALALPGSSLEEEPFGSHLRLHWIRY